MQPFLLWSWSTLPRLSCVSTRRSPFPLALDGGDDGAGVRAGAELEVPDALPGAGGELAVGDGDGDAAADEGGFDVCLDCPIIIIIAIIIIINI